MKAGLTPPSAQLLVDSMATAVVCLDAELRILLLNPAAEALFGVSARHCRGARLTRAVPGLSDEVDHLRRALDEGAAFTERALKLTVPGGEPVTVDCTVTPFALDDGGRGVLLEFLSQDRHLRISREDQLRTLNQANREMLRGLAHEIKNPLGGLRGAAQLLAREQDTKAQREYSDIVIREVDRLQRLVDGLLGPKRPPEMARLNVHEPLEYVLQLVAVDLPDEVTVERDYDPSIPELTGDRELLIQALLNLVGNAIQAVGDKGTVTLRTRTRRLFTIGGTQHRLVAEIAVLDNGPGIPEELLPRIFHPMVTSRAEGTGMGLPIAQYLIHLHGGAIECDSRPGATRFAIYLPLEAEDE